jgi:NifB/MoaA-like Fe-S oxidoreductase
MIFEYDINHNLLKSINSFLKNRNSENVLIATSSFAYPLFKNCFRNGNVLKIGNLFFGGSIGAAGLLTCKDVIEGIEAIDYSNIQYLLLPPIMFDEYGRDLTGMGIWEIEETLGIKTVVL